MQRSTVGLIPAPFLLLASPVYGLGGVAPLNPPPSAGPWHAARFMPAGTKGYPDLRRDALEMEVMGVHTVVASLADVIRSKEAAGRPKDQLVLPVLRRLLEEGG